MAPEQPGEVRKYIVAVLDPACGRLVNVAVLEPEYREDLSRYISLEELRSYVLAEQELQLPRFFQQAAGTVQVAAANEAGQSPWAVLQIPLLV